MNKILNITNAAPRQHVVDTHYSTEIIKVNEQIQHNAEWEFSN